MDVGCRILEEELKTFWPEWHVVRYLGGGALSRHFRSKKQSKQPLQRLEYTFV